MPTYNRRAEVLANSRDQGRWEIGRSGAHGSAYFLFLWRLTSQHIVAGNPKMLMAPRTFPVLLMWDGRHKATKQAWASRLTRALHTATSKTTHGLGGGALEVAA